MENEIAPHYNLVCNFRKKKRSICLYFEKALRLPQYAAFARKGYRKQKSKEKKMLEIVS